MKRQWAIHLWAATTCRTPNLSRFEGAREVIVEPVAGFNRYLFARQDRQGAVIDERFNGGGSIADYMVDLLSRQLFGYFNNPVGDRQPWKAPPHAGFLRLTDNGPWKTHGLK